MDEEYEYLRDRINTVDFLIDKYGRNHPIRSGQA